MPVFGVSRTACQERLDHAGLPVLGLVDLVPLGVHALEERLHRGHGEGQRGASRGCPATSSVDSVDCLACRLCRFDRFSPSSAAVTVQMGLYVHTPT